MSRSSLSLATSSAFFYEFSECPVEELGFLTFYRFLLRFGRRISVGAFFIFKFQIASIAIRTDVKFAEIAVMFGLFVFLSDRDTVRRW